MPRYQLRLHGMSRIESIDVNLTEAYMEQGDFVDRGHFSLETLTLLLVLKARCDKVSECESFAKLRQSHCAVGIDTLIK